MEGSVAYDFNSKLKFSCQSNHIIYSMTRSVFKSFPIKSLVQWEFNSFKVATSSFHLNKYEFFTIPNWSSIIIEYLLVFISMCMYVFKLFGCTQVRTFG